MKTIVVSPSLHGQAKLSMASVIQTRQESAVKGNLIELASELSSDNPWAMRQAAARKLGTIGDPRALPILLEALPKDSFWMVRQAIIQAVEMIGDARSIPALVDVAENDSFAVVRGYAAKTIERLGKG